MLQEEVDSEDPASMDRISSPGLISMPTFFLAASFFPHHGRLHRGQPPPPWGSWHGRVSQQLVKMGWDGRAKLMWGSGHQHTRTETGVLTACVRAPLNNTWTHVCCIRAHSRRRYSRLQPASEHSLPGIGTIQACTPIHLPLILAPSSSSSSLSSSSRDPKLRHSSMLLQCCYTLH